VELVDALDSERRSKRLTLNWVCPWRNPGSRTAQIRWRL